MNGYIKKYAEKMDNLHMSRECEAEIIMWAQNQSFENQNRAVKKKVPGFGRRRAAVVLVSLAVLGTTLNVFGTQLKEKFTGIFSKNEEVSAEVFRTNFYDSDGHVEINVEEVLSDTMSVRAVVHYKALDSEGKKWMASILKNSPQKCLYIIPEVGESILEKNINYENDVKYLQEFSDESDIYLELEYFSSNADDSFESVRFYYSMPTREVEQYFGDDYELLDISEAIQMETYEIEPYNEQSFTEEKNYIASWVKLSKLGLIVGGYSKDAWITYKYGSQYTSTAMRGVRIDSLQLVYQDGEVCDLLDESADALGKKWTTSENEDWNEAAENDLQKQLEDLENEEKFEFHIIKDGTNGEDVFYAICFYEPVNTENIKGIIIDGKMYEFKK